MSYLPFPADSAEFEEYTAAMEELADLAEASAPDPEPSDMGKEEDEDDDWDNEPNDEFYLNPCHHLEDQGGEDRYLDASWEDRYDSMDSCYGDF